MMGSAARTPLTNLDLASPAVHAEQDLGPVWDWLRRHQPLVWHPAVEDRPGFWVASTHSAATAVYRDATQFTSRYGNVLDTLLHGGDRAGGRMLAVSDGARHQRIRRELLRCFSPTALTSVRERVRHSVHELVRSAVDRQEGDFAAEVAQHVPLGAICDLMEIPAADRDAVFIHASSSLASHHDHADSREALAARNEILLYFSRLLRSRAATTGDSVLSRLVAMSKGPLQLSAEEMLFNCYSLLLGGDETTRLVMVGAALAFAQHPEQWRRLRDGQVSVETAADELFRWTTPAMHGGRTVTADTEFFGQEVSAGDIVVAWNSSANRDETEFPHADQIDLGRSPNRHLAFAYGPHFCIGVQLARIEVVALLESMIYFVERVELIGPPAPIYSNFLSGFHRLPIRLIPRKATSS